MSLFSRSNLPLPPSLCHLAVFLCLVSVFLSLGQASIFYSGHTLPVPRYRSYFQSVGDEKLTKDRYETSVIIQGDILVKKQCECIQRHLCRSPRNIITLQSRDCHHHEKVCCEI